MESLFKTKFNWLGYLLACVLIRTVFIDLSWFSFFALMVSLYQFMLLFDSMGHVLPVRYLLGSFMCLQFLIGPTFAYNGLDQYQRGYLKMQIPETEYFIYALPAVIAFILGLHINAGRLKGEVFDQEKIKRFVSKNGQLPYYFVGVGFCASMVSPYFGSELAFVFTLLGNFKFIGAFLLILGGRYIRPAILVLIFGSIILSSLRSAMFHDLMTWLIFLGAVLAIKFRPSVVLKLSITVGFILLALLIQQMKTDYRKAVWSQGGEGGVDAFGEVYEEGKKNNRIFSIESLGSSNIRINQGFIITNIMQTVPARVPHENGAELLLILESAILPRILAPNKLNAGDREIFMKYSGMPIAKGTSMGLSSVGDAYINFGTFGGVICMFFYGMLFSWVLNLYHRNAFRYPVLILFTPLVFYYPIRPDCELQTILGHLFKSSFLIFVMIQVWKYKFLVRRKKIVLSGADQQNL